LISDLYINLLSHQFVNLFQNSMCEEAINICWRAPSNIALIKYWGKRDHQLPDNGSLSITLEHSSTTTALSFRKKKSRDKRICLKYYFQDEQHLEFEKKIDRLLIDLCPEMPFLTDYELIFHSDNNFPHSTGIASSASSMAALALCLVTMEELVNQKKLTKDDFFRRASSIARLGSGSASRSVFGGVVTWGNIPSVDHSSDEYATPFPLPQESRFNQLRDIILIVSTKEKTVSSTSGHALMNNHPYREGRKAQANSNLCKMIEALRTDDYQSIAAIAENEALSLHALLMSSSPDGLLLNANTLHLIEEIKRFRTKTAVNLFFTIDAGPNLHLMYFEDQRESVLPFVQKSLLPFCEDGQWIDDKIGSGPVKL
jgi:diphosphomevalonate decarboxylase